MRITIYARRSTDEHQAASLEVQIQEARRWIAHREWQAASVSVVVDDAVSRAEFKRRRGLSAILAAARARTIDILVMRDESRLGGDMVRSLLVLSDLVESGVRIFYYCEDREVSLEGPTEKIIQAVRGYAAEMEREKVSGRTREHLQTKARRGLNAGGRCFGYENVPVHDGEKRVCVDYRVNPEEAAVVVEIFERYSRGEGVKAIAKGLNHRGVPKPRAGKRGTGSWAPSAVWGIVRNERYRGRVIWGRTQKCFAGGTKVRRECKREGWLVVDRPDLRIVPDDLWQAVHARIDRTTRSAGPKGGRPHRYLLSGIARCGSCGGPLTVVNHRLGKDTIKAYTCSYHRDRGAAVCASTTRRPVEELNGVLVNWIKEHVLTEELMLETLRLVRSRLSERARVTSTSAPALAAEASKVRGEIERLGRQSRVRTRRRLRWCRRSLSASSASPRLRLNCVPPRPRQRPSAWSFAEWRPRRADG